MRLIFLLLFTCAHFVSPAQHAEQLCFKTDSLMYVAKDAAKGFHHGYILFVPKGTPMQKKLYLLVEPNNTGKITDSIAVHKKHAIDIASVNSIGNNISRELKIPLLVPVFPRPASQPLLYTHALDRDIMMETTPGLQRPDLQLLEMINDARSILAMMNIQVNSRIFMNGFSASATFTNRFSFMHPGVVKALAIGGFNGKLMIPKAQINGVKLNYPIGTNDFFKIFSHHFDIEAYRQIRQFIYMGKLDDNDAVQFDDAYNNRERKIINKHIGKQVQERYLACKKIYADNNIPAIFRTYDDVGHWTTSAMNLETVKFFLGQMQSE